MSNDNNPTDSRIWDCALPALGVASLLFYGTPDVSVKSDAIGNHWVENTLHIPPDLFGSETRAKGIVYSTGYTVTSTATATAVINLYPSST